MVNLLLRRRPYYFALPCLMSLRHHGNLKAIGRLYNAEENAMPEAVIYKHQDKIHTVYFSRPHALLPVKLGNGEVRLVTWGRRQQENSEMPLGGWARLNAIHNGK